MEQHWHTWIHFVMMNNECPPSEWRKLLQPQHLQPASLESFPSALELLDHVAVYSAGCHAFDYNVRLGDIPLDGYAASDHYHHVVAYCGGYLGVIDCHFCCEEVRNRLKLEWKLYLFVCLSDLEKR